MLEQLKSPSGKIFGILKAFGLLKSLEGHILEFLPDETIEVMMKAQARQNPDADIDDASAEMINAAILAEAGGSNVRHAVTANWKKDLSICEKIIVQIEGLYIADEVQPFDKEMTEEQAQYVCEQLSIAIRPDS